MSDDLLAFGDLFEAISLPKGESNVYIPKYKNGHLSILDNCSREGFVANLAPLETIAFSQVFPTEMGYRWVPISVQRAYDEFRTNRNFREIVKKCGVQTAHAIVDYRALNTWPEIDFGVIPYPQIQIDDDNRLHLIGEPLPVRKVCPTVSDCLKEVGILQKSEEDGFNIQIGRSDSSKPFYSVGLQYFESVGLALIPNDMTSKSAKVLALMKIEDPKSKEAENVMYV